MKAAAFYSIKGGVGKTAASVNFAYLAAEDGYRTLLCDLDPQGASSYYFKVKPKTKHNSQRIIKGGKKLFKSIRESDYPGLDIIPSDLSFRQLDIELSEKKNSQERLAKSLSTFKDDYDLIILDCPPNITLLSENILEAADYLLVPMIPTVLSKMTLEKLLKQLKHMDIDTAKVYTFFAMADYRKRLHKEVIQDQSDDDHSFASIIPYSSVVEKMGLHRAPLHDFAPSSRAAAAYKELWSEMKAVMWK
ncbi:MAG: AAA family ATPase [Spirochaetales bacterium]|nr:AAA family ATPase [Spirochaetales bacterium]